MTKIHKYPRTKHIEGSALQEGDHDLSQVPFKIIAGRYVILEEKVDGANMGMSFDNDYNLWLQSRGHYLTGGPRERHFAPLKRWASWISSDLLDVLEDRYIVYMENMYAKHTCFYDMLPHFFMEFDILDTQEGTYVDGEGKTQKGTWLSTDRRAEMLKRLPIVPVKVLYRGVVEDLDHLKSFLVRSHFRTEDWWHVFIKYFPKYNANEAEVLKGTDPSELMEGLYIKVEEDGKVVERYKFVRHGFLQRIKSSQSHWLSRPIIPNILEKGSNMFQK